MSSGPGDVLQLIRRGEGDTRRDIQSDRAVPHHGRPAGRPAARGRAACREAGDGHATGGRRPHRSGVRRRALRAAPSPPSTPPTRARPHRPRGRILADQHRRSPIDRRAEGGARPRWPRPSPAVARRRAPRADRWPASGISDPRARRPADRPARPAADHAGLGRLPDRRASAASRLAVPVFVDNDANAMALGEQSDELPGEPLALPGQGVHRHRRRGRHQRHRLPRYRRRRRRHRAHPPGRRGSRCACAVRPAASPPSPAAAPSPAPPTRRPVGRTRCQADARRGRCRRPAS